MKLSLNIKSRLALWYLLIVALILVFFSFFTYIMLNRSLYDMAQSTTHLTVIPLPNGPSPGQTSYDNQPLPVIAYVINEERLSELQAGVPALLSISTMQGLITLDQKAYITPDMRGEQQVEVFWRPSTGEPNSAELMVFTRAISEVNESLAAYTSALYYVIPITAVLAAALGFFLIWRMLKPVNTIARTAREIEEKDLDRRIKVESDDELGRLATTLNQTFERLQQAFQRERQFTADASHELRTPLAVLQSETSLALSRPRSPEEYQKSLEVIGEEIGWMSSIVNKMLALARADSGSEQFTFSRVDLNELLADLASDIEVLSEEKALQFQLFLEANLCVRGDRTKLRELFMNLLDNAIRYTPSGGKIVLSLKLEAGKAQVAVIDTGMGIPPEHLPHIFERFYRVNRFHSAENNGSGLGLAICQYIIKQHKGEIKVSSQAGKGSTFIVILPVAY